MIKDFKKGYMWGLLGIFLLVIAWQMGTAFAETPKRGGWLTLGHDTSPVGWDPHLTIESVGFTEFVYDSLLRYSYDMDLEPALAASWEHPDPRTYIFHLRKGVKFHNGREMTSEDVKFSFDRLRDPKTGSQASTIWDRIESIEIQDKYTVKMTLKETLPDFLTYCAYLRYSAVLPKDELLKHGTLQKADTVCGTGPWKLKEYEHGVSATYVRNDDYWEPGIPYLDGFKIMVVKDEASRLAGIRTGRFDIGWVKGIQVASRAAKEPNVKIISSPAARQGRLYLNHKEFPFNNLKLRQALSACIDRQAMIDKLFLGKASLSTLIPPVSVPYVLSQEEITKLPFYKQDYDLARKLLKEAGYPNGFEFTIITSTLSPDYVPACEMMQGMFSKVGIKAKIQQMEWGVFQKVRRKRDYQATYYAGSWKPDPMGYFYYYVHGKSESNETNQNDPELNNLMDKCLTEQNLEKRKEYFRQLQYKAAEQVVSIFPYASSPRWEIVRDHVQGYRFMSNNSRIGLREAWISK
jgi:peptide/nickel transport system substrate-binding protein